jgi:hypothetical protein
MLRVIVAWFASWSWAVPQEAQPQVPAPAASAVIEGRVLDLRAEPVPAARIAVSATGEDDSVIVRGVADGDGFFRVRVARHAAFRVSASGEGLCTARTSVSDAAKPLLFRLKDLPADALPTLSALVVAYDDGNPNTFPAPWHRPAFDGAGVCELHHVPRCDEYLVRPLAKGFAFDPHELRSPQAPHVLEFTASPFDSELPSIRTRLVDREGKPLAGIPLVLRGRDRLGRTEATTDANGLATLASPFLAGTKVAVATSDDGWVLDQDKGEDRFGSSSRENLTQHECTVDPTTVLELRAVAACSVSGRLVQKDGRPAAFTAVALAETRPNCMPAWVAFAWATTDRFGHYHVRSLHHLGDPVRVQVEGPAGSANSEPLAMAAPGTRVTVPDLRLAAPATIEGVVRGTDRQGRYRFVGVPPGGAWLQLLPGTDERAAKGPAVDPFDVEPGTTYTHDLQLPAR